MPPASTFRDLTNAPLDDLLAEVTLLHAQYMASTEWFIRHAEAAKFDQFAQALGQIADTAREMQLAYSELSRRGLDANRPGSVPGPELN